MCGFQESRYDVMGVTIRKRLEMNFWTLITKEGKITSKRSLTLSEMNTKWVVLSSIVLYSHGLRDPIVCHWKFSTSESENYYAEYL